MTLMPTEINAVMLPTGANVPVAACTLALELERRGCKFIIDNGDVLVSPAERLTDEDRARIREHHGHLRAIVVASGAVARQPRFATTGAVARLLSLDAAAEEYGFSVWTLRDLVASGRLKAVQPPGVRRIWLDRRDLDRAIESWKS